MPRKHFRKFLPTPEKIRENRYVACFGPRLQHHNLWLLHRRSVAGGVAAGLFAGLVPGSNPVQFLTAALLAVGFKVNLPIAMVVTLYSNPFTVVPLYYIAFKIGQLALPGDNGDVPSIALALEGKSLREWMPAALEWVADAGYPLLIGLPLLALLLAGLGYVVTDWAWRLHVRYEWHRRQQRRANAAPP
jgi:uncharacterized protein